MIINASRNLEKTEYADFYDRKKKKKKKISSISLMDSMPLLKCLVLQLSKKPTGNLNLGRLCFAFPPQINCIGKKWLFKVIVNVPVILRLSDDPAIEVDLEFCFAIV